MQRDLFPGLSLLATLISLSLSPFLPSPILSTLLSICLAASFYVSVYLLVCIYFGLLPFHFIYYFLLLSAHSPLSPFLPSPSLPFPFHSFLLVHQLILIPFGSGLYKHLEPATDKGGLILLKRFGCS